jgi:hypothetical protein
MVEELLVILSGGASKNRTVDSRMKRLNSSSQEFGRFGVLCNLSDSEIAFSQQLCGSARGEQRPAKLGETFCKLRESGLVVNRKDSSGHLVFLHVKKFLECTDQSFVFYYENAGFGLCKGFNWLESDCLQPDHKWRLHQ